MDGSTHLKITHTASRVLLILLASLICATGCKWSKRNQKPPGEQPGIEARDPAARASFEEARGLLRAGRYEDASRAFASLQAEHPDDPIAALAELYTARAALQTVSLSPEGVRSAAPAEVIRAQRAQLDALIEARRVDDRVRFAAMIYRALCDAALDDRAAVLATLKSYPAASLGAAILDEDRTIAWALLLESMDAHDRPDEAFTAAAMLHEEVSARADAADATDATRRDAPPLLRYARARGLDLARYRLEPSELQLNFLTSALPFLRGLAGWGIIAQLSAGEVDEAQRLTLEAIFVDASPALVEIGALEAAAEASAQLAMMGEPRRIVLGALLPMRGADRGLGQRVMRGMLLAQRSFEGSDAPRVTLVFRDSTQDAEANMAALRALGALGVIGPIEKDRVAAYSAAATTHQLPLLTLSAETLAPHTGEEPTWVFRNFLDAQAEAVAVAALSAERYQDRRVAIIWPNVGYGRAMAEAFKRAFVARGGEVVAEVEYPRADTDFTRTAAKVAKAKPDAIFIADTGSKVSEITAYLARQNVWGIPGTKPASSTSRIEVHYLGTSLWQDPQLLRQAASYVGGATIPAWYSPVAQDSASARFTARYREVFAAEPSIYEAFAYDAVVWLRQITLDAGVSRPQAVRDLLAGAPREGVTGLVRFGTSGEPDRTLRLITVTSGAYAPLPQTQRVTAAESAPTQAP